MDAARRALSRAKSVKGHYRLKSGIWVPKAAMNRSRLDQMMDKATNKWDSLDKSAKKEWINKGMLALSGLCGMVLEKCVLRVDNTDDLACVIRRENLLLSELVKTEAHKIRETIKQSCESSQNEIQRLRREVDALKAIIDLWVLRSVRKGFPTKPNAAHFFDPEKVMRQMKVTPAVMKDGERDVVKPASAESH